MENNQKNEVFTCHHCGNKTSQKIIGNHSQEIILDYHPTTGEKISANQYFTFFECSTCFGLTIKTICSEEIDDPNELNYDKVFTAYPREKEFPENMPKSIVSCYKEAIKVKKVSPLAFSILIRRALEVMFVEQNIKGDTLNDKIKLMAKKDILPNAFIKMAEAIRLFGNSGAHQIDPIITADEVESLDYFFNATVEYVYIAPNKIKKIEESLKKSGKKI